MRFIRKTIVVASIFAVIVTIGRMVAEAQQAAVQSDAPKVTIGRVVAAGQQAAVQADAPKDDGGVTMSLAIIDAPASERWKSTQFKLTFESKRDTILRLGTMFGNGVLMWPDAVHFRLTTADGRAHQLKFWEINSAVDGPTGSYNVPLRAGSAYTLKLSLGNFWPKAPETGKYSVRAEFQNDTALQDGLHLWTGRLESNEVQFDIGKKSP